MVIEKEFATHGHVVRLAVEKKRHGWDVREECDACLVHVEHHDDWHRIERAVWLLEMEARRHDPAHATHR